MLIHIGQSVQKYLQDSGNITYYAQELIQETFNLTRMNLVMRGIKPSNIKVRRGDTLAADWPYFDDNDENSYEYVPVDCVVSNPPYSHKWDASSHINDPRYRDYGTAPASKADYAFLLHDLYHLKDNGIMCIVMPHGVLFRGGSEKEIRQSLIAHNNIETIIGMPANCFFGTGIPTIIMILKKHREASDVLIIDASKEFFKDGNKNRLSGHHIKKIVDAVLARQSIPHFATLVTRDTIIQNDYNLNIPRYVEAVSKVPVDLYATVFGGIPNYEIDELQDYWAAFPSLREELFSQQDTHTSVVCCESVKKTIRKNRDIMAFEVAYKEAFQELENELYSLLIDSPVENVHSLKLRITEKIFDLCRQFQVVDKYLVYKAFDEEWEQISIDLEAIRLQGLDVARSIEDIEEYDRSDGFFRRQLILTTKRKPPDRIDDPNLSEKLCEEMEGIFLWAMAGLLRLVKNNFQFTESGRARLNREMVKKDANNIELFLESKGYIVRDPERSISSKDLYAVYCTWCDENAYPPMKRKTFVEYLSANEEKLGIHYTTHLTNSAGREVRGFRGIGSIISPSGYMPGGWQKVDPDDNPFKDA